MIDAVMTKGLAARVAVLRPAIVGAAFRIYLLGGSSLDEKEAAQAAGSAYLLRENRDAIMSLVSDLEARTVAEA